MLPSIQGKGASRKRASPRGRKSEGLPRCRDVGLLELARRADRVPVADVVDLLEIDEAPPAPLARRLVGVDERDGDDRSEDEVPEEVPASLRDEGDEDRSADREEQVGAELDRPPRSPPTSRSRVPSRNRDWRMSAWRHRSAMRRMIQASRMLSEDHSTSEGNHVTSFAARSAAAALVPMRSARS